MIAERSKEFAAAFAKLGVSTAEASKSLKNLADLMAKMKTPAVTPVKAPSPLSAAPSWASTSLDWLKQNRREFYIAALGIQGHEQRLAKALIKMGFQLATWEKAGGDVSDDGYAGTCIRLANAWSQASHEKMVAFLDAGGLEADRAKLGVVSNVPGDPDVDDVVRPLAPKAQMSPEHELEELLDQADREATNPDAGSW